MSSFHAQKGFVHFVFGNFKDCYLLPSLVQVDLNGYLYCQLKKQGYEGIYFISGMDGDFILNIYDEDSRELYQKLTKKGKGLMGFFGKDEEDAQASIGLPGGAECARRFTAMLKKGHNLAFVFRLNTFSEIFGGEDRERLAEFSRTGHKYLEQNGNILVFQLPMTASGSLPWLTDRKGVFAPLPEYSLCPEMALILEQEHSVKLYEQMSRDMGERCVFLNRFTPAQMEAVARRYFLTEKPDWSWQEQDVQDLGYFLCHWYGSAQLRRETGPILSENETKQFSLLLRDLRNATAWWSIQRSMTSLRNTREGDSLKQILQKHYPPDSCGAGILSDSLLARKMKQIQIPDTLYGSMPELGRDPLEKFQALVQEYQTPRSHPMCPELEKTLMQCLSSLEAAANRGDTATFERAVKALRYGVTQKFRYEEGERQVWTCQVTVLQLSEDIFRMDRLIQEDTRQLSQFTLSKKRLIRQIEEERKASGLSVGHGLSPEEHALSIKMHEAVNLDRQIDNLTRARTMKLDRRAQSLDSLRNLELAIGNLGLGIVQNVDTVLRSAVETMERDMVASNQAESALQELGKTLGYVMQEAPGQMDTAHVEAEYEKLLNSMDEEEPLILLENG